MWSSQSTHPKPPHRINLFFRRFGCSPILHSTLWSRQVQSSNKAHVILKCLNTSLPKPPSSQPLQPPKMAVPQFTSAKQFPALLSERLHTEIQSWTVLADRVANTAALGSLSVRRCKAITGIFFVHVLPSGQLPVEYAFPFCTWRAFYRTKQL